MLYNINLIFNETLDLTKLGISIQNISLMTSMDSIFPQMEVNISTNIDLVGQGIIKFGSPLTLVVFNDLKVQILSLPFCIYNIELINQTVKYSTVGTLRISCVFRWYFNQLACSVVYYGTPADALVNVLTEEAKGEYTNIWVQKSFNERANCWYRCGMTAMKFMKTVLEPNYLIDESPAYVFATDLGDIITTSYLSIANEQTLTMLIDPFIVSHVPDLGDDVASLLGYTDFKLSLGSEHAWQSLAQRLVFMSEGYSTISGGVEPSSYLNPGDGSLPPRLVDFSNTRYTEGTSTTQIIMDDSTNSTTNMRARFLNTFRKKGLECFKIDVACDNDFRLAVGATVHFKLTSLSMGNPEEIQNQMAEDEALSPLGVSDSILSGRYFIKNMRRTLIPQIGSGPAFTAQMNVTLVKLQ